MQLTTNLQATASYWANLQVSISNDWKEQDFRLYYYLQFADTLKYILKNIFIGIIKEQCSDQGASKWKYLKGCQNNVSDIQCRFK